MRHASILVFCVLAVFATVSGCRCDRGLNRTGPVLVVDKTTLDFGTLQVNLVHEASIHVINDGTASLTLSEPTVDAPFALKTDLPITFPIGAEGDIVLTYSPTVANQINEGNFTFRTDDAENITRTIKLRGQGIAAVATVTPNPIAFGDVYAKESKQVVVKLTNSGTNDLQVQDVAFTPGTTATITGDLTPLKTSLPAGASAQTTLTFAPQDVSDVTGGLRFTLPPLQGGQLDVPVTGRGIRAIPQLCFRYTGAGTEQCTEMNVPNPPGIASMSIQLGSYCDNFISPRGTDGGCTAQNGERTGEIYLRNSGNVPVSFSGTWRQNANVKTCGDAGVSPPDFTFSNAPDAGAIQFNTATSALPGNVNDPRPWESAPVVVKYAPTSRCLDEAADLASIQLARQGEPLGTNRTPTAIILLLSGSSALPNAQPSDVSVTATRVQLPRALPFVGVINPGSAPVTLNSVELMEELLDAGAGDGPNGGVLVSCSGAPATSQCARFAWAPGGNPNTNAPITLPASDGGSTPAIGTLLFGPDGGYSADGGVDCVFSVCPNFQYTIYGVTQTSDPYHPRVVAKIKAQATN